MALYVVTGVRFDMSAAVEKLRWLAADRSKNAQTFEYDTVDVTEVVAAIDRGDIVEIRVVGPYGPTSGGRLAKQFLASGKVTVAEAKLIPGRTLHQLPRI